MLANGRASRCTSCMTCSDLRKEAQGRRGGAFSLGSLHFQTGCHCVSFVFTPGLFDVLECQSTGRFPQPQGLCVRVHAVATESPAVADVVMLKLQRSDVKR